MKRNLIVIGGSAGSLGALKTILPDLPRDLPAAVCVVVHIPPRGGSELATVLSTAGSLPVIAASEGEPLRPAAVYVARPDHHLLVGKDHLHLTRGPKEGLHRPSINATFRSAAQTHGAGAIGVLLSGMLDDGASGLWEIRRHGGVAIVQDPEEAAYPSMPLNALADAPVQYRVRSEQMARLLIELTAGSIVPEPVSDNGKNPDEPFSGFTCPECRGPLFRRDLTPTLAEFRCRVGHAFSPEVLLEEHTSTQERKLYEALLALEEGASLAEYLAENGGRDRKANLIKEALQLRAYAASIRRMIENRSVTPLSGPLAGEASSREDR